MREIGFLHDLKVAFNNYLDLKSSLILKLHVLMDLSAKTIITPPKIILNSEYLPRNLKAMVYPWINFVDAKV